MSGEGVAYRSTAPEALQAWEDYKAHVADVRARRDVMRERYGRGLMVNRLGFGHGTRVVGFEQFDTDEAGDIIGDEGELRIPKAGWRRGCVVPNARRKAGKALEAELALLSEHGPELPGMPAFALVGLCVLAPAIFEHEGAMWVRWSDDVEGVSGGWERIPLSAYFAAQEANEPA